MSDIADVLKLAEVINSRRESDKTFNDLLTEISTALADIVSAMEKPKGETGDALAKAVAAAILQGMQSIKPPTVNFSTPEGKSEAWSKLDVKVDKGPSGTDPMRGFTITKIK